MIDNFSKDVLFLRTFHNPMQIYEVFLKLPNFSISFYSQKSKIVPFKQVRLKEKALWILSVPIDNLQNTLKEHHRKDYFHIGSLSQPSMNPHLIGLTLGNLANKFFYWP